MERYPILGTIAIVTIVGTLVGCGNKEENVIDTLDTSIEYPIENTKKDEMQDDEKDISEINSEIDNSILETNVCTTTAMYVPIGDSYVFIGDESGVFITNGTFDVFNINGELINFEDLQAGNIVEIDNNGMMLESYPGQLANVYEIRVIEIGTPKDISKYQEIIDDFMSVIEENNSTIPDLTLEYSTEFAFVGMSTFKINSSWKFDEGCELVTDSAPIEMLDEYIPEIIIEDTLSDITFNFTKQPNAISINLILKDGIENIPVIKNESKFMIEKPECGLYSIHAEWNEGFVNYAFKILEK